MGSRWAACSALCALALGCGELPELDRTQFTCVQGCTDATSSTAAPATRDAGPPPTGGPAAPTTTPDARPATDATTNQDAAPPPCRADDDCGPPLSICAGRHCVPGCANPDGDGCGALLACDDVSGRCGVHTSTGGLSALDATCTRNWDCRSEVCVDFGGATSKRCVKSCGKSTDCPEGFTCYDRSGSKVCVSKARFSGSPTFAGAAGQMCMTGADCRSNYCPNVMPQVCVESCKSNADCSQGACTYKELDNKRFIAACQGPIGAAPMGASCEMSSSCASGLCVNSACTSPCASVVDCSEGQICALLDQSECVTPIGPACLQYQINVMTACATRSHGADPIGASCTAGSSCRSGLCFTGRNECTDPCATDADCPITHRCKPVAFSSLDDGQQVYVNACLPADVQE